MIGDPDWCSNECDITAKLQSIKFPKHIEILQANRSSANKQNSYVQKFKDKLKKFVPF